MGRVRFGLVAVVVAVGLGRMGLVVGRIRFVLVAVLVAVGLVGLDRTRLVRR